ncbi:magnesium-translocating P-type ATPase [Paenibacillus dendritiformis]|uniref:Magnesium-transporting ATPase, P-type 1 n=1 Tax=Paenibacillus dendritiformis C454 TaxID=1131935 RepID=H3SH70_9BACL|nr:magnesium-translocating P-type ATPase [Paenibacillus dendritiformis]EHQ61604.1 magnesium-translocating P-type ATPase [Paenibacillus dendritiformis C454]CAH8770613.1 magnesium-translocating P-type ATPase [Paenibacillus dendritiformis]
MARKAKNKDELAQKTAQRLIQASISLEEDVMEEWHTRPQGLTDAEASARIGQYGKNQVAREKPPAWYIQLLSSFGNPFILILLFLAAFSYIAEQDIQAVLIISTMVTVSVIITFTQEFRSSRTAEKLSALVRTTTSVCRQGRRQEIDNELLVPGDIIYLSAGDMVPADVRLIAAKDVYAGESALTGEALPVEKFDALPQGISRLASANRSKAANALELTNIGYMGTNIISGTATAVVIATGSDTYFGSMASHLTGKAPLTSFDLGVKSITYLLIRFMLIMVPVIFFINGFTKGDWWDALLFGLSVAVGLTPEMLPVVVAGNLAKGAATMARNKVVVKRLHAIQNLGAMDILCTDKTGTLTEDQIVLEQHLDINGNPDKSVLEYACLNSYHQTGLSNLLDAAILKHTEYSHMINRYTKLDEIPFDFNRRRMSVVLRASQEEHLLVCKGAVEEVLDICTHVYEHGQIIPLTADQADKAQRLAREMNEDGLRVLAVAMKRTPSRDEPYGIPDEQNLVLVGCLTFLDPPKPSAQEAIRALADNGVNVKVITGDNAAVACKVCRDVGIRTEAVLLGEAVDALTDEQLAEIAELTTVFAKINPLQKARIVRVLKSRGHTVGFMGDGINDAVSLKEADVGISVDTAVDIAKESADMILLEKSLMVLEQGVIEGRKTFGNMIKYIKMTASSNFGNMFSVLAASAFLPFLPMLPIHLLLQNLFYDISQLSIPWDTMDKEYLRKPQKWNAKSISRFMVFIGPISSIFDITTYALMWYVFSANSVDQQALFHSGWFIEGLLSQTLIVHMIRTEKIPFVQSTASTPVLVLTGLVMACGIALPFTGMGAAIGLVPLPLSFFPWLVATLLCYCVLTQTVKTWYIRKFGEWL